MHEINDDPSTVHIVDDNIDRRNLLSYIIQSRGHQVSRVSSVDEALITPERPFCKLVVMTLDPPHRNAVKLCESLSLSSQGKETPIIIISSQLNQEQEIELLKKGASDCLVGTLNIEAFLIKMASYLNKSSTEINFSKEVKKVNSSINEVNEKDTLMSGPFFLHLPSHQFKVDKKQVYLTLQEFKIMCLFLRHPSWVLTREQIIEAANGGEYFACDRVVDVQISHLRKKISPYEGCIKTIRGMGYKFDVDTAQTPKGLELSPKQTEFNFTER